LLKEHPTPFTQLFCESKVVVKRVMKGAIIEAGLLGLPLNLLVGLIMMWEVRRFNTVDELVLSQSDMQSYISQWHSAQI
jgi:hypothetical protein